MSLISSPLICGFGVGHWTGCQTQFCWQLLCQLGCNFHLCSAHIYEVVDSYCFWSINLTKIDSQFFAGAFNIDIYDLLGLTIVACPCSCPSKYHKCRPWHRNYRIRHMRATAEDQLHLGDPCGFLKGYSPGRPGTCPGAGDHGLGRLVEVKPPAGHGFDHWIQANALVNQQSFCLVTQEEVISDSFTFFATQILSHPVNEEILAHLCEADVRGDQPQNRHLLIYSIFGCCIKRTQHVRFLNSCCRPLHQSLPKCLFIDVQFIQFDQNGYDGTMSFKKQWRLHNLDALCQNCGPTSMLYLFWQIRGQLQGLVEYLQSCRAVHIFGRLQVMQAIRPQIVYDIQSRSYKCA